MSSIRKSARGQVARAAALQRYGLERFCRAWDAVLERAIDQHVHSCPAEQVPAGMGAPSSIICS